MRCEFKKISDTEVIMNTEKGNRVKIIFSENDNYEVEDIITNNLLTSYEQRMKDSCIK